jgi:uncharacterized membrane protein
MVTMTGQLLRLSSATSGRGVLDIYSSLSLLLSIILYERTIAATKQFTSTFIQSHIRGFFKFLRSVNGLFCVNITFINNGVSACN